MPTYDYVCRFCEHTFEEFQGLSEPLRRKCPACGRMGLDRLIGSGIGIVFKGSGFYETDYKRAQSRKQTSGEKQSDPSADTSKKEPAPDAGSAGSSAPSGEPGAGGGSAPGQGKTAKGPSGKDARRRSK